MYPGNNDMVGDRSAVNTEHVRNGKDLCLLGKDIMMDMVYGLS